MGDDEQEDQDDAADQARERAAAAEVGLDAALRAEMEDGFGAGPSGDDRFDAVVGLFGMLNVVLGLRPSGEPDDPVVRRIEGWMLGLQGEA